MRYFLGLDVAKDSFAAPLRDETGQLVSTASFANDVEGFSQRERRSQLVQVIYGVLKTQTTCQFPTSTA